MLDDIFPAFNGAQHPYKLYCTDSGSGTFCIDDSTLRLKGLKQWQHASCRLLHLLTNEMHRHMHPGFRLDLALALQPCTQAVAERTVSDLGPQGKDC